MESLYKIITIFIRKNGIMAFHFLKLYINNVIINIFHEDIVYFLIKNSMSTRGEYFIPGGQKINSI